MQQDKYEFKLPVFLLPALINADLSGLTNEDMESLEAVNETIKEIKSCYKKYKYVSTAWDYENEEYFTWHPDFCSLGCDVVDAELLVFFE